VKIRRKARSDWLALVPNAHEGYVSWEKAETIPGHVSTPAKEGHDAAARLEDARGRRAVPRLGRAERSAGRR
jgi:hypothetical protein